MSTDPLIEVEKFQAALVPLSLADRLEYLADFFAKESVFTSSFGLEDQLLTHFIAKNHLTIPIMTLDTGRLFAQTYQLWQETEEKYGLRIKAKYPRAESLENLIEDQGINGFYYAPEMRKSCCFVRKVEPLARALQGKKAWITGLRGNQSAARENVNIAAYDEERGLYKFNPLYDFSREAVRRLVEEHDVPVNPLHAHGFLSIGCAPCTRAVQAGQDERAGRWWWEGDSARECGLHVKSPQNILA